MSEFRVEMLAFLTPTRQQRATRNSPKPKVVRHNQRALNGNKSTPLFGGRRDCRNSPRANLGTKPLALPRVLFKKNLTVTFGPAPAGN